MSHPDPKIAAEIEAAYAERAAQLQNDGDVWAASERIRNDATTSRLRTVHAAEMNLQGLEADPRASHLTRNAAYVQVERASEALSDAEWDAYQTWKSSPAQSAAGGRAR